MNLLQTKRAKVDRLKTELQAARNNGAGSIGQFRQAQSELKREQAELAKLEARLRELKEHFACLGDL